MTSEEAFSQHISVDACQDFNQSNLSLSAVEVLADVLLDLDEAHLALGVPAPLVLLLPRSVTPLELAPENG